MNDWKRTFNADQPSYVFSIANCHAWEEVFFDRANYHSAVFAFALFKEEIVDLHLSREKSVKRRLDEKDVVPDQGWLAFTSQPYHEVTGLGKLLDL